MDPGVAGYAPVRWFRGSNKRPSIFDFEENAFSSVYQFLFALVTTSTTVRCCPIAACRAGADLDVTMFVRCVWPNGQYRNCVFSLRPTSVHFVEYCSRSTEECLTSILDMVDGIAKVLLYSYDSV